MIRFIQRAWHWLKGSEDDPPRCMAPVGHLVCTRNARHKGDHFNPLVEPECNGLCVTAMDLGVQTEGIAYANIDCPLHGEALRRVLQEP